MMRPVSFVLTASTLYVLGTMVFWWAEETYFPPEDSAPLATASDLVLALTWQPSFCERRATKRECLALNAGDLPHAEQQLSLHGLWPQPRGTFYCGVSEDLIERDKSGAWSNLPALDLSPDTRAALDFAMPGSASFLDRHEWIKHGTCYAAGNEAEAYFADTLLVMEVLNTSSVGALLSARSGQELATNDLRAAFNEAFGAGTGQRIQVICKEDQNRTLVEEIRLHLRGSIQPDGDLGALLGAADPAPASCAGGVLDPAGLQ